MKDVNKLYMECRAELKRINMDISDRIVKVSVNGRLSRALGRCKCHYTLGGEFYEIEINPCMLGDEVEDKVAKNTMIHELIHTCPGCMNHGIAWTSRAERVNRMLGYNVKRLAEAGNLEANGVQLKRPTYKYAIVCDKCGGVVEMRSRWSSTLETINRYRHGGPCRGTLHVMEINNDGTMIAANNHR